RIDKSRVLSILISALMQQPPPPQFSPDGLFWWDGVRWVPRPGVPAMPAPARPLPPPAYSMAPPGGYPTASTFPKPSPGLRIVLIVALSVDVGLTGLLMLIFLITGLQPDRTAVDFILTFAFAVLFGLAVAALIGVVIRDWDVIAQVDDAHDQGFAA